MNIYRGYRTQEAGACQVVVNDEPLDPRHDLVNHSPNGFQWGYGGSGPAQLALAILAHEYGRKIALQYYQRFKFAVIARIEGDVWIMNSEMIGFEINRIKDKE